MITSPTKLGPENDCAGEDQAIVKDRPVLSSDGCFIPRQTGRLTFCRNVRLRLRIRLEAYSRKNYLAKVEGKTVVVQEGNGTSCRQSPIVSCYK
jgi:hypothetical protein